MMEEQDIEKLFRDNLGDFQVTPPDSVKQAIDAGIGDQHSKRRGWLLWSFLLVLFVGSGATYWLLSGNHSDKAVLKPTPGSVASTIKTDSQTASGTTTHTHSTAIQRSKNTDSLSATSTSNTSSNVNPSSGHMQRPSSANGSGSYRSQMNSGFSSGQKSTFSGNKSNKQADLNGPLNAGKNKHDRRKTVAHLKSQTNTGNSGIHKQISHTGSGKTGSDTDTNNHSNDTIEPTKMSDPVATLSDSTQTEKFKTDSVSTVSVDSTASADTTNLSADKTSDSVHSDAKNQDKSLQKNWMVQAHFGVPFIQSKPDAAFQSAYNPSFGVALGFYRNLNAGPLKRAGIDFGYTQARSSFQKDTMKLVFYQVLDSVPIYDTNNVIIGYQTYLYTDSSFQNVSQEVSASYTQFAFGLQTQLEIPFSGSFGVVVSPGIRYALNKTVFANNGGTSKSNNLLIRMGIDLYYDWRSLRFSLGLDSRMEWLKSNSVLYPEKSRTQFVPRIGVAFQF